LVNPLGIGGRRPQTCSWYTCSRYCCWRLYCGNNCSYFHPPMNSKRKHCSWFRKNYHHYYESQLVWRWDHWRCRLYLEYSKV